MDLYEVVLSEHALKQLDDYISYIQYTLLNDQAADSVLQDAGDTIEQLKRIAGSLKYCDDPELKERKYRKINFLKHNYLMLYKLDGNVAYVNGIYHQLQDYENLFINEFDK